MLLALDRWQPCAEVLSRDAHAAPRQSPRGAPLANMSSPAPIGASEVDLVDLSPVFDALGDTKVLEIGAATLGAIDASGALRSPSPSGGMVEDRTGDWGPIVRAIRAHPSPLLLIRRAGELERTCYGVSYVDRGLVGFLLEEPDMAGWHRFVLLGIRATSRLVQRALEDAAAPGLVDLWYPHPSAPRRLQLRRENGHIVLASDPSHSAALGGPGNDAASIEQLLLRQADEL